VHYLSLGVFDSVSDH